jgi:hypothetical protein
MRVRLTVQFIGGGCTTADVPMAHAEQVLAEVRKSPGSGTIALTDDDRTTLIRTAAVACVDVDEIP